MASPPLSIATRVLQPRANEIAAAAAAVREGRLVAFPTETVYGLGANALDDFACSQIFNVKDRPRFNPLIVHVLERDEAEELALFNPLATALADAFWPGGLTLVLPRREPSGLALLVSAGLNTVALRSPAHEIARALLEASGLPIAAPSANRSGRISPTTAQAVLEELNGRIDCVVDGGPCRIGLESTVIGFEDGHPVLLRSGAIPRDAIERIAGPLAPPTAGTIEAPGMLESHYAPRAKLRLNAAEVAPDEALLAFGNAVPAGAKTMRNLSPRGDLAEAAANFFAMLRELDASELPTIAVMPVPDQGLGEAINDRLARAAAPREAH